MTTLSINGVEYPPSALSFQDLFMEVLEISEERFPTLVAPLATLGATALRDIVSGHLPIPTPSDVEKIRKQNFRISELSPTELRVLIYSQLGRIGLIAMRFSSDENPGVRAAGENLGMFVSALGRLYSLNSSQTEDLLVEELVYIREAFENPEQERSTNS